MPYITTQAIVLTYAAWRENDRILTLISPDHGRIDALCRGCRKPKSPLAAAGERFTLGEYVFFAGKDRKIVQSCGVIETFYPLRLEYERLAHAAVLAAATQKAVQADEPAPHLFILLARSLKRLAFEEETPMEAVTCAFLLHFTAISGFLPRLSHCVRCGRPMGDEGGYLLPEEGGVCCAECCANASGRDFVSAPELSWLRQVKTGGIDKADKLAMRYPLEILVRYAQDKLDMTLPPLPGPIGK